MRSNGARGAWIIALGLAAGACDGRSTSSGGQGANTAANAAGAEGATAPAGPAEEVQGEEFVAVARHEASARVGQATTAVVSVTGKPEWHVNREYPAKLQIVSAEGFTFAAETLRGDAAAQFDDQQLRFEVPLTPQAAGDHPVELKFKFGMCSGDRCVTREANFRWTYRVEG